MSTALKCDVRFRRRSQLKASLSKCLLAFICVSCVLKAYSANPSMQIDNSIEYRGVKTLSYRSPEFTEELGKLFSTQEIATITPLLPFSLIMVNDTGRYIYKVTVVFTFPDNVAPSGTPAQFILSPTAGSVDNKKTMIAPGDCYFFAPLSGFLAARNSAGQQLASPYFDKGLTRIIEQFKNTEAKGRIAASVDSIILEDGQLWGPDSTNTLDRVNERIRAERDLVAEVKELRGDRLRKTLEAESKESPGEERHYNNVRSRTAQFLLQRLKQGREEDALDDIQQLENVKWFSNSQGVRKDDR